MKSLSKDEIIKYLSENKKTLHDQFGVIRIGIFGSYSSNTQNPSSDIDMVVEFRAENKDIHNFLRLKRFLESEFGKKVDLGFEHSLKPIIRKKVKEQIIYA